MAAAAGRDAPGIVTVGVAPLMTADSSVVVAISLACDVERAFELPALVVPLLVLDSDCACSD